jgi:hypothetical protein
MSGPMDRALANDHETGLNDSNNLNSPEGRLSDRRGLLTVKYVGQSLVVTLGPGVVDRHIAALTVAAFVQTLAEGRHGSLPGITALHQHGPVHLNGRT